MCVQMHANYPFIAKETSIKEEEEEEERNSTKFTEAFISLFFHPVPWIVIGFL